MARRFGIATFFVFCLFGVEKITSGAESCGCFGVLEIPPIVSLATNIILIGLLLFWPARASAKLRPTAWAVAGLLCVAACLYPVFAFTTSTLSDVGHIIGGDNIIVIDTSTWVNKPLPIERFIDGEPNYTKGDWRLVLYHENCPVCQRVIQSAISETTEVGSVFVEVPPYKSPPREERKNLLWRRLSDEQDWFVAAPDVIEISDGVVTRSLGQLKPTAAK